MTPFMTLARVGALTHHLLPLLAPAGHLPLGPARPLPRWAARRAVRSYQRTLSPRKGFSCAHRVVFKGSSCSQYFIDQLDRGGFRHGLTALRSRLASCRAATGFRAQTASRGGTGLEDGVAEGPDGDGRGRTEARRNCEVDPCHADLACEAADCLSGLDGC